jgi:hypothetical protein
VTDFFNELTHSRENRLLGSSCSSVCPSSLISTARSGRISVKLGAGNFYECTLRNSKFGWSRTKAPGDINSL